MRAYLGQVALACKFDSGTVQGYVSRARGLSRLVQCRSEVAMMLGTVGMNLLSTTLADAKTGNLFSSAMKGKTGDLDLLRISDAKSRASNRCGVSEPGRYLQGILMSSSEAAIPKL